LPLLKFQPSYVESITPVK